MAELEQSSLLFHVADDLCEDGALECTPRLQGLLREFVRVLIGVPSYEDVPASSNPEVENLETALLGVRAALESHGPVAPDCFEGVAIYANWVTDEQEWTDFERVWRGRVEP